MLAIISRFWMMSLQAGILILIVLLVRALLKKYPKIYTYCLWSLVGVRLLCPIFVETAYSLQPDYMRVSNVVLEKSEQGMLQDNQNGRSDFGQSIDGKINLGVPATELSGTKDGQGYFGGQNNSGQGNTGYNTIKYNDNIQDYETEKGESVGDTIISEAQERLDVFLEIVAIIYVAGIFAVAVFYFLQYLVIRCRVSTAVRDSDNVWLCDNVSSPFVIGIIRPRIILPYTLSEKEKQYILRHEQTHIKHHDSFIRLIGLVCLCLHWWNPLVWLAVHKMNQDMEMFCDEAALKEADAGERKAYARTLLSFAARQNGFSVGLAFGESDTERRVKNIMNKRKGGLLTATAITVLAVFCVIAFMTIPKGDDYNNGSVNYEDNKENAGGNDKQELESSSDEAKGTEENGSEEATSNNIGQDIQKSTEQSDEQPTVSQQIEKQSVNAQLELIADNIEGIQLLHEWVDNVNRYAVTDLDQNGRLEVIASNMGGTGAYTYSRFYEVNESFDGLAEYDAGFEEGHSQPDIIVENVDMYYDATENIFYYIEKDDIKAGATEYHSFLYAMSLSNGKLVMTPLSDMIEIYPEYKVIYKDGAGKEITKNEYDKLVVNMFADCDKYGASFGWQNSRELAQVTDKATVIKLLSESYDRFEFYVNYEDGTGGNNLTDAGAYNAYAEVLENLYYKHEFPGGENVGIQPENEDASLNRFAVVDIDSDGRDELVVAYTTTYTAGQTVKVYDYDSVSSVVREQFSEYPAVTFFDNGVIIAQWSHSHGRAPALENFWPYRLYRYDSLSDKYVEVAIVDAWDENYYNQENSFPKEKDDDGDGILYYIMPDGEVEYIVPYDGEKYNEWMDYCIGGAEELSVPYMNMSLENIESIKR